MSVNKFKL